LLCIVIAVINGIEISHNYLLLKVWQRALSGLGFTLAIPITILYNHRLSAPLLSMQQHMLALNRDL